MLIDLCARIACIGDARTGEVEGVSRTVGNDLDVVWILHLRCIRDLRFRRRHHERIVMLKRSDKGIDYGGVDQGLIALHVDDEVAVRALCSDLGEAIRPRRVVGTRHDSVAAVLLDGRTDTFVIRRHDDLVDALRPCCPLIDADDHRLPRDIAQGLPGQSCRCIPRRDNAENLHAITSTLMDN